MWISCTFGQRVNPLIRSQTSNQQRDRETRGYERYENHTSLECVHHRSFKTSLPGRKLFLVLNEILSTILFCLIASYCIPH